MPLQGWLWLDDCEILNDARFQHNVTRTGGAACNRNGPMISWYKDTPAAFRYDPCNREHLNLLPFDDIELWPWYDYTRPEESSAFLGFYVTETTFDSTFNREVKQRGLRMPGASFPMLRRQHREIVITVLLAAEADYGLQYGFDWLSENLAYCDESHLAEAMIRLSGASETNPWMDMWTLEGVGLIDALKWGEMPLERNGCLMREATFTIGAADPDRRTCPINILPQTAPVDPSETVDCMEGMKWLCGPFPEFRMCAEMPAPGNLGYNDAIVTIQTGKCGAPPMHVYGALNPLGLPCADPTLELCLDVRLTNLGAYEKIIVDSTHERVWIQSKNTVNTKVDGIKYLVPPKKGLPKYVQLSGCMPAWIWVEPENAFGLGTDLTVQIDYVHRVEA